MPLPDPLRLAEIAVAMGSYILPPQTSTTRTSSPTSQATPSSPAVQAAEGADIPELKEDMLPGAASSPNIHWAGLHGVPTLVFGSQLFP